MKIISLPDGKLVVTESGNSANGGRVSLLVEQQGRCTADGAGALAEEVDGPRLVRLEGGEDIGVCLDEPAEDGDERWLEVRLPDGVVLVLEPAVPRRAPAASALNRLATAELASHVRSTFALGRSPHNGRHRA